MQRLIDADALKLSHCKECSLYPDKCMGDDCDCGAIIHINAMPTIEAEPIRHGKNIGTDYDETDQFVCSECGIELQGWYRVEHDEDDGEETYHEYRLRYCPHCGTRIDGK